MIKRIIILVFILFANNNITYGKIGMGFRYNQTAAGGINFAGGNIAVNSGSWIGTSQVNGWTFTSNPYIYTTSASVGIGTATPSSGLHVSNNDAMTARFANSSASGNAAVSIMASGNNNSFLNFYYQGTTLSSRIYGTSAKALVFGINGASEAMRITSTGAIGINTTTPGHLLDIGGKGKLGITGVDGTITTIIDTTSITITSLSDSLFPTLSLDASGGVLGIPSISFNADRASADSVIGELDFYNNNATAAANIIVYRGTADTDADISFKTVNIERLRINETGAIEASNTFNFLTDTSSVDDDYGAISTTIVTYTTGMMISYIAQVANTDAATFQLNSLGAKTIKKLHDQDIVSGDIEVGQVVMIIYDGTNFQMISQLAQ